jgi:hypothetical protein
MLALLSIGSEAHRQRAYRWRDGAVSSGYVRWHEPRRATG